jgi:lipopolysaccharide transport protein LptA/LPS export ABC transporter protein LptC
MLTTFDADRAQDAPARGGGRATGAGIVLAADRSGSFRQARQHTTLVKMLRLALPAAGMVMCALYAGALVGSSNSSDALPGIGLPRITPQDLAMQNPNYEGVTADGGTYRVAAARARQDFERTDIIELEEITGDLVAKDKTVTKMTAVRGQFNHKDSVLDLKEKIEIRSTNGFTADLTSAVVRPRAGRINSDEPVKVGFPAGSIAAKHMEIRQKEREITFVEEVAAVLTPPKKTENAAAAKTPATGALLGSAEGPVDITAARLDIQDIDKRAVFTGNVRAAQAGSMLETPELTAHYEGQSVGLPGAQPNEAGGGKLTRIVAKGPFVMTRENGDRVTGDGASFDAIGETGVLAGNIVMTSQPDRRVTADRVELDQRRDGAVLTGNVLVVSGDTMLKGRRLAIDRAAGRTALTAPPMSGSGPGRISARFVQKDTGKKKQPQPENAAPGVAQFKTSPDAPVDVEADSLDVDDNARVAIFRGDVVTKQGEVTMQASEIQAHYTGSARLADTTTSAAQAPEGGAQLSRIDATGSVVVTSADGRKVTGSSAIFDTKSNSVVVSGDVELSQAGTVVRGSRLVIDMTTGRATIDTTSPKAIAKPSEGWSSSVQGRSTGGRPSAIFFPDELRKAQQREGQKPGAGKSPSNGSIPDIDGWSSQTVAPAPR